MRQVNERLGCLNAVAPNADDVLPVTVEFTRAVSDAESAPTIRLTPEARQALMAYLQRAHQIGERPPTLVPEELVEALFLGAPEAGVAADRGNLAEVGASDLRVLRRPGVARLDEDTLLEPSQAEELEPSQAEELELEPSQVEELELEPSQVEELELEPGPPVSASAAAFLPEPVERPMPSTIVLARPPCIAPPTSGARFDRARLLLVSFLGALLVICVGGVTYIGDPIDEPVRIRERPRPQEGMATGLLEDTAHSGPAAVRAGGSGTTERLPMLAVTQGTSARR